MMNGRGKVQTVRKKGSGPDTEKRKRLTQRAIVDTAAELFARDGFGATSRVKTVGASTGRIAVGELMDHSLSSRAFSRSDGGDMKCAGRLQIA